MWVQHGRVYLPKSKLRPSLAGQSVAVFSSRNTGSVSFSARRCSVASGRYTTLRQVGHNNHPLSSLRLRDYCLSPVQQYVARQPEGNKKQCNTLYMSRSGAAYASLNTSIHMAGLTICPVCSRYRSPSARSQLTYVVQCQCVLSSMWVT